VGSLAVHFYVARIVKKWTDAKWALSTPFAYWGTLVVSALLRVALVVAFFGSFKACGEFLKLNGVTQEMRRMVGGTDRYAHKYYLEQRPLFFQNTSDFTLRRSWSAIGYPSADATWEELLTFRVQRMAELLERENTLDFLIEKDKCYMYDFFKSQAIPYVDILSFSSNIDAVIGSVRALLASDLNTTAAAAPYPPSTSAISRDMAKKLRAASQGAAAGGRLATPSSREVYIKACHLTQGSDNGTLRVIMSEATDSTMEEVSEWVRTKFRQKPSDFWRPWSKEMNKLLAVIRPGVMIQRAFDGPNGDAIGLLPKPIEAKVEVLWGRAYLAFLHDYKVFALRNGQLEKYQGISGNVQHIPVFPQELAWVADEQHDYLTPVFELAELVARRVGIEQIRVDIFIRPGQPKSPVVNEISLASGVLYRFHAPYLARLWVEGYQLRGTAPRPHPVPHSTTFWFAFVMVIFALIAGSVFVMAGMALHAANRLVEVIMYKKITGGPTAVGTGLAQLMVQLPVLHRYLARKAEKAR